MTVSVTRKWRQSVLSKNGPASATLDFSGPLFRIVTGLTITVAIVSLAVCGYVLHGWSWQDGLYMVIITIFGVGCVALSLYLLPRLKGAIVAYQWSRRLHGFGKSS